MELEKCNLANELKEMKNRNSNPKIEQLTKDLNAVALSKSQADTEIRRLRGLLQETQTRLQDAEPIKTEQARTIENSEQLRKDAYRNQGGSSTEKVTVGAGQITESKQTIVCESFSCHNENVTVSSCKRSVKSNGFGYCFLDHPKIQKNQILRWSHRVPKFKYSAIGMVIILE